MTVVHRVREVGKGQIRTRPIPPKTIRKDEREMPPDQFESLGPGSLHAVRPGPVFENNILALLGLLGLPSYRYVRNAYIIIGCFGVLSLLPTLTLHFLHTDQHIFTSEQLFL